MKERDLRKMTQIGPCARAVRGLKQSREGCTPGLPTGLLHNHTLVTADPSGGIGSGSRGF